MAPGEGVSCDTLSSEPSVLLARYPGWRLSEEGVTRTMATTLLVAAAEAPAELPLSPVVFALGAVAVFAVLLGATYAFRNVNRRH